MENLMLDSFSLINRENINDIYHKIKPYIRHTPIFQADFAGFTKSEPLSLKLESLQHGGSFKARGAFANLVGRAIPESGVVAASGGNHGVAIAYAAERLGIPATIFVPQTANAAKIARIRSHGAVLNIVGSQYAEALAASQTFSAKEGALNIHAFDQIETVLGQGTIGSEIEKDIPDCDTILVPVGGGGLIAGIAAWFGERVKIVAVEPENAPTLTSAFAAGQPVDAKTGSIARDSLSPNRVGEIPFSIARTFVKEAILVTDEDIRHAQNTLWERFRIVAEPGGAATTAALISGRYAQKGSEKIVALLSGANTDAVQFEGIIK